jgi:beta-lactamase regulating signal transducer with metallopeptidase domain
MFAESLLLRWTDVASAWLLTYLVHSTVLIVGVWLVASRRSVRDTTRDVLWKLALVGGIVSASAQSIVSREPLAGQVELDARRGREADQLRVAVREGVRGEETRVFVAQPKGPRWTAVVVVLWVTGAGAALLWLTWRHARGARLFADRTPLDGTPVAAQLRALLAKNGIRQPITLTCSTNIASPVAMATGEVCLPRRALIELDATEKESMLAHEIAHMVRRDPHWLIAAQAIEAVLFVQPLNHIARRRMQAGAEFLCDDWAVQRTSQPVTLAKCLAAVAEWVGRAPRLHAMSAMVESGGSPLVQRVRRILSGGHARRAHSARGAVGASACALVALAMIAPRISIAGEVFTDRTVTFVRAFVARDSVSGARDTLVIVREGLARVRVDSLLWRARTGGVARAGVTGPRNVIIRRRVSSAAVVTDSLPAALAIDSLRAGSVWKRALSQPAGVAVGGLRTRRNEAQARMILIERR